MMKLKIRRCAGRPCIRLWIVDIKSSVTSSTVGILKLRDLLDWETFRPVLNEVTGYALSLIHI